MKKWINNVFFKIKNSSRTSLLMASVLLIVVLSFAGLYKLEGDVNRAKANNALDLFKSSDFNIAAENIQYTVSESVEEIDKPLSYGENSDSVYIASKSKNSKNKDKNNKQSDNNQNNNSNNNKQSVNNNQNNNSNNNKQSVNNNQNNNSNNNKQPANNNQNNTNKQSVNNNQNNNNNNQKGKNNQNSNDKKATVNEKGYYYDLENVVLYVDTYKHLPNNYITKKEAEALGWQGGSIERYKKGAAIGGSRFGNYEGKLPSGQGIKYTECDIDTQGAKSRGAKRMIYSSNGKYYYTEDHYESFVEVIVINGEVTVKKK